jgi:hypothetical protein
MVGGRLPRMGYGGEAHENERSAEERGENGHLLHLPQILLQI